MASRYWPRVAVVITYDEGGGWFDHVRPPAVDRFGLGTRVPALVVSPYARRGLVAHGRYEHASILKLIEWRFNLEPLTARDRAAGAFLEAFDFSQPPRRPSRCRRLPMLRRGVLAGVLLAFAAAGAPAAEPIADPTREFVDGYDPRRTTSSRTRRSAPCSCASATTWTATASPTRALRELDLGQRRRPVAALPRRAGWRVRLLGSLFFSRARRRSARVLVS